MPNQTTDTAYGFTPTTARELNHRKNTPYKIITDRGGLDWLVDFVADNGRLMHLIMVGTHGRVCKHIITADYSDFQITLGPEDL